MLDINSVASKTGGSRPSQLSNPGPPTTINDATPRSLKTQPSVRQVCPVRKNPQTILVFSTL